MISTFPQVPSTNAIPRPPPSEDDTGGKKKKTSKRRKVNHACLYCRRSHMTCDEGRPCQRCIKREIGHLCHDEHKPKERPAATTTTTTMTPIAPATAVPTPSAEPTRPIQATPHILAAATTSEPTSSWSMNLSQGPFLYQPETLGNEFSVLTDFLETLDEGSFFSAPSTVAPSLMSSTVSQQPASSFPEVPPNILPSATKQEKFLLMAADQEAGTRDERLNRVIRSKYEAGLLKPYNYVKGYARLSRWMDRNVSQTSKQQILQPLSVLRPKFRAVAQSLRDIDLVFIEEAFERMLLDYDRVFSAMGVPACLWRRTGEIYKGNRQFSELVGVDGVMMRDGRLCIYELMAEESAVNYWEKYGHVAFDSSQKAVLTSCVLRYKPVLAPVPSSSASNGTVNGTASTSSTSSTTSTGTSSTTTTSPVAAVTSSPMISVSSTPSSTTTVVSRSSVPQEEGFIDCCFSFTIRRDKWGIPSMIVGNFIKC